VLEARTMKETAKIVALIPCHNEENLVWRAIRSLHSQTRPPDRIVVIADNCTDGTARVALSCGAEVRETVGNRHKKAGALNQVLKDLLPELDPLDMVLVQDADSFLDERFVEYAERKLQETGMGGVGGTFRGREGGGFVGMLQRNEYVRYARDVRRLRGKALCLTGTATLFSVQALRSIADSRASGEVYDTTALTEDFEVSLMLQHLGYRILAPRECTLTTEVMETWGDLARQRLRWKRGAIENLTHFGLTRVTLEHWARQIWTLVGIFVVATYLATLLWAILAVHDLHIQPLWIAVSSVFVVERALTVKKRGWKQVILASLLVVEMPFELFLQVVHLKAWWQVLLRTEPAW
jgi:cellulose synthase/poly-beta-1,6-N-acetylglucosamine synthase-like glycosyltransferase